MKKSLLFSLVIIVLSIGLNSCHSNKIACPTYADSQPKGKKKGTKVAGLPDTNAPGHHHKMSRSVMPGDGRSTKTKVPN